jgi:hypothetical protein
MASAPKSISMNDNRNRSMSTGAGDDSMFSSSVDTLYGSSQDSGSGQVKSHLSKSLEKKKIKTKLGRSSSF